MKNRIAGYISYLKVEKGYSQRTVEEYRLDVERFLVPFLNKQGIHEADKVTKNSIQKYLDYLAQDRGNCSATRARKLASAKTYFNYLVEDFESRTENWNRHTVSLNIEKRRGEQDQSRTDQLARENERRAALGLEPIETLDDLEEPISTAEILLDQAARTVAELDADVEGGFTVDFSSALIDAEASDLSVTTASPLRKTRAIFTALILSVLQ